MALTAKQVYVVEGGGTLGWEIGRNDVGDFVEGGLKVWGAFQALLPSDQIIQSQRNLYSDLTNVNLRNAIGMLEVAGRFRIAQLGHDRDSLDPRTGYYKGNPEDLILLEAGYQNNSGLQQLNPADPLAKTRHRFVGRFLAYPEINAKSHTRVMFGVEYNSGFNGGPRDVRLFYGASLDPASLLKLATQ